MLLNVRSFLTYHEILNLLTFCNLWNGLSRLVIFKHISIRSNLNEFLLNEWINYDVYYLLLILQLFVLV